MRYQHAIFRFLALSVLACGTIARAGPLSPPNGPVGPTFKTLVELEPRTAVGTATTPGDGDSIYRIAVPGSYYLTSNVTGVAGKSGIEIAASHVTLDLGGFELSGSPDGVNGVIVEGEQDNVVIRNGTARGWTLIGIDLTHVTDAVIEDVRAIGNGAGIVAGNGAIARRCIAIGNPALGIGLGQGSATLDSTSRFNGGHGFYMLEASRIESCTSEANGGDGIYFDGAGCMGRDCVLLSNAGHGLGSIYGGSIRDSTAEFNGLRGLWSLGTLSAVDCRTAFNGEAGIRVGVGSTVIGCTARGNATDGIVLDGDCDARNNHCTAQIIGAGIFALGGDNRMEANSLIANLVGLDAPTTGNLIIRNSAKRNDTAYLIDSDNAVGPIVPGAEVVNSKSPHANFAD